MKGVLYNEDGDLQVENGSLKLGQTTIQEVAIIIGMNPGELKRDPVLGPALVTRIRGSLKQSEIQQIVRLHLQRDGKRYEDVSKLMTIKSNSQ